MLMHDTSGKPQWRMFLNMGQMRGRGASDMGTSLVQSDPGTCANAIEARERVEQERDSVRQELLKSREEIERLHNDMQRYDSTCSNKIKQLEESYQQLQTTRSAEVDLVAKEHERQLGLLKKQLQQEMALNSALTRKVEDRDATIANWREDKQREIVSATDKATKELNRNIEELEHASSRARELLMEKIEYLERLVKEHVEQAESLRKLLQQEMDRTSALTKEITDVKAHDKLQLDEVKEQLVTSLEEIDRLMNELTRKNSSLSTETKQLQDDYEKLKKERDSDVQRVVNERKHQIESLKNQLRQELDRTSALSKAIAEKEATITKWNVDKQKDIEVAKENAVKQISQDLEEVHRMKERTRKLLVDKIENLEFVIGTLREDHAKDVAAVRNEVYIEKQAAKREYENAFAAKFAEFRKQVEEQNREHIAELKLALVRAQKEQDALKQGQAQQISALRYAQEHQKQAMEQKHNETVAALELEAIKTRRRFADAIKAKDAELVESLDRLRHEMDNEIAVRQSRHVLEVKDLMDSVRCLKVDNKELDMKISLLQQNYSDAIKVRPVSSRCFNDYFP
jgi:myosin heavy subunit